MSIESDLTRIATSLEVIATHIQKGGGMPIVSLGNPGKTDTGTVTSKAAKPPKNAPVAPPIVEDPLAEEITQEQVHLKLQVFMEKFGVEGVKNLMIKHGASKIKPTITSIPAANYAALVAEIG